MKNVNPQTPVLTGLATASINGSAIDASQMYQVSFQTVTLDTAAAGTMKIQMSNDPQPAGTYTNFTPTNWSDIPNSTSTVTAGVASPIILSVVSARWLRVVFTRSAGTLTINVNMFAICI